MTSRRRTIDPLELLLRRADLPKMLNFFVRLEERLTSAFGRAARAIPESNSPSAKQVRGSTRRHYLDKAMLDTAADVGLSASTGWTDPPTWSFPLVKSGGFSLTLGIVETKFRGAARTLRTRSKYLAQLCERNAPLNPQGSLFDGAADGDRVVPDGALGALIVVQYRAHQPDVPAFLGFWVPSEDLKQPYYVRSFDEVITMIRDRLSLGRRASKKIVQRKPVRRKSKPSGDQ